MSSFLSCAHTVSVYEVCLLLTPQHHNSNGKKRASKHTKKMDNADKPDERRLCRSVASKPHPQHTTADTQTSCMNRELQTNLTTLLLRAKHSVYQHIPPTEYQQQNRNKTENKRFGSSKLATKTAPRSSSMYTATQQWCYIQEACNAPQFSVSPSTACGQYVIRFISG